MNKKKKINLSSIKQTALEIVPHIPFLLDPEIISNPSPIITKILQGVSSYFISKFASEYSEKMKKKEVKNNNFATEKPALILVDFMKIINEGEVDEERFKAMKSIFFAGVSVDATQY